MQYVKLGSTGLDVSRICVGCMSFGLPDRGTHEWTLDEEASRPLIRQALDAGINFFDTSKIDKDTPNCYNASRGIKHCSKRIKNEGFTVAYQRTVTDRARASSTN